MILFAVSLTLTHSFFIFFILTLAYYLQERTETNEAEGRGAVPPAIPTPSNLLRFVVLRPAFPDPVSVVQAWNATGL